MADIITYSSTTDKIDLTPAQVTQLESAGVWPRDSRGEEYHSVSHGRHVGRATFDADDLARIIAGENTGDLKASIYS